jgi:DNA-binding winged helix-turn-helix (wHTH) protein/Tol biopolymer transport system component
LVEQKSVRVSFGPFTIADSGRVLFREGEIVQVPPKALATLVALVGNPGRVVTKEALLTTVWPDTFVEEGNLTQNISVLRKLLAPDFPARSPIETIPKVGYRFREDVRLEEDAPFTTAHRSNFAADFVPERVALVANGIGNGHHEIPAARTMPASPRRPWLGWTVAAMLCCILVVGASLVQRMRARRAQVSAPGDHYAVSRFTDKSSEDQVTAVAMSPDGKVVVYADADGVVLQRMGDAATHLLTAPAMKKVDRLAWFPDGLHLALSGADTASGRFEVWMISILGDAPRRLLEDGSYAIPSPDGSLILFTRAQGSEVWVSGLAGENAKRLFAGTAGDTFYSLLWSADSRELLLERRHPIMLPPGAIAKNEDERTRSHPTYMAIDVASGATTYTLEGAMVERAVLSRPDELLFSRPLVDGSHDGSASIWRVSLDPRTGAFTSAPEQRKEIPHFSVLDLTIAQQTGDLVAVLKHEDPEVYTGLLQHPGPHLEDVKRLSLDAGVAYPHAWNPDSSAVLYESNFAGGLHIYRQRLDRHDPELLVSNSEEQFSPRLSPDHRWILYLNRANSHAQHSLGRIPFQGGTPIPVETNGPAGDFRCPLFHGSCMIRTIEGAQPIVFSDLDPVSGKGAPRFTLPPSTRVQDWDIAPDGSTLAWTEPSMPTPVIRTLALAGGGIHETHVQLDRPIESVNWAADQKGWFVAASSPAGKDIFHVDLDGHALLLYHTRNSTWAVPSPDGERLAFVENDVDSNLWVLRPEVRR